MTWTHLVVFVCGVVLGFMAAARMSRRSWKGKAPCPHEHCTHRLPAPGLKSGGQFIAEVCSVCQGAVKWNSREDAYERVTPEEARR